VVEEAPIPLLVEREDVDTICSLLDFEYIMEDHSLSYKGANGVIEKVQLIPPLYLPEGVAFD